MDEQKKMFTNKSVTLFLVIVISVSAIFETIVIALRAMGLAVFLMWVPTIAAIIAGCISQKESNGKISFKKLLQSIGFQKLFPERTNVEFVEVLPDGSLRMRVWERGSGITMACGTGACATAVAAYLNHKAGRKSRVRMDGGDLQVHWNETDGHVYMTGPAVKVFDGEIEI